jgi:hypothetical protein
MSKHTNNLINIFNKKSLTKEEQDTFKDFINKIGNFYTLKTEDFKYMETLPNNYLIEIIQKININIKYINEYFEYFDYFDK